MDPSTTVSRPSGRYCAELKPTLARYWYHPVTGTTIVGEMEGTDVGNQLGETDTGFAVGMKVGMEVGASVGDEDVVGANVGLAVEYKWERRKELELVRR